MVSGRIFLKWITLDGGVDDPGALMARKVIWVSFLGDDGGELVTSLGDEPVGEVEDDGFFRIILLVLLLLFGLVVVVVTGVIGFFNWSVELLVTFTLVLGF